jgi:hypothetical protein
MNTPPLRRREQLYAQLAITATDVAEVIAFAMTRPRRMTLNRDPAATHQPARLRRPTDLDRGTRAQAAARGSHSARGAEGPPARPAV